MNTTDRRLLCCISGLIAGLLTKYFVWVLRMSYESPLTDLGNTFVQTALTGVIILSIIGMVWFGMLKRDD